ncbi:MAG: hypothetical protein GC185_07210 [Alphaproteobacteria bacterium]|nr:hypothetical protein [Alphaproteobacteria bacterium]
MKLIFSFCLALFLLGAAPAPAKMIAKTPPSPAPAGQPGAAPGSAASATPAGDTEAEKPAARAWRMVADKSAITFTASQMGDRFTGSVKKFTPAIFFDADDLAHSSVTVDIDAASIDAGEKERNENIKSKSWFDIAEYPAARFETTGFTKTGENAFTAQGRLTIRGVTVPVELPFTLAFSKIESGADSGKEQAVMDGKLTLDRSKFKLGQGDWADPTIIANEVDVAVHLTAVSDSAKQTAAPAADAAPENPAEKEKTPTP